MFSFAALHRVRKHPAFAEYFAAVLPIFWPVVFWNLLRMAARMKEHGHCDALVILHWWGGIEITHFGDPAHSPSAYRAITPACKAWDDPVWETALPTFLNIEASAVICPRTCGGSGRPRSGLTKGACALTPQANTS